MASREDMINVSLPKEFLPLVKDFFEKDNSDKNVRIQVAIMLFITKKVTFEHAADLSGYSLNDFINLLNGLGISWMEYGEEEFLGDMEALKKLRGEK